MRKFTIPGLVAVLLTAGLAVSGCTNRPLSALDTYWLTGNTHPYLVLRDGEVEYSNEYPELP